MMATMQPTVAKKPTEKFLGSLHQLRQIKADANGELPTDIMLVKAGTWPNSVKGAVAVTVADLNEMAANFNKGVGRANGGTLGLPIDFMHQEWDQAAGWINEVEVRGDALWSVNTEWSDAGKQAVLGKMFKCISPSFYPSDRGGYVDPEDYDSAAIPNTLVGAALTNIPFFKGLTSIKADNFAQDDNDDNMLFISDSDNKIEKDEKMTKTLDQVRILDASALDDEDKAVLKANEKDLSADEKTKFAAVFAASTPTDAEQFSTEDRQILADIKSGAKVVMSAEEKTALESKVDASAADVKAMKRRQIEADITEKGIKPGKIVADQLEKWANLVEADASNMELLEALHDNAAVAADNGKTELGGEGQDQVDAAVAVQTKTVEILRASREAGTQITHAEAKKQAEQELAKEGK